ncbi:MAG TPA: hypothetical protein VKU80_14165 [Planctomycetota bacterium]|nr:hypothetical protein [Planctomycetota bacterium]
MAQDLFGSSARSKLDRLAAAARTLHKALIDATQRDYEKVHGRITSPYTLFALVANDPAFAWLQPMTRAIVEVEDLAGRKMPAPVEAEVKEARQNLEQLLRTAGQPFADRYLALIQSSPEIAVEDGRFHAFLRETLG